MIACAGFSSTWCTLRQLCADAVATSITNTQPARSTGDTEKTHNDKVYFRPTPIQLAHIHTHTTQQPPSSRCCLLFLPSPCRRLLPLCTCELCPPSHATMTSTPPRTATTSKARRRSHVRVDAPCPSLCAAPGCRFSARTMHDMAAHHARSHGEDTTHSQSVPLLRRASKQGSRDLLRQRQEKRKRTRTPRRHEPHAVRADMVSAQCVRNKKTHLTQW